MEVQLELFPELAEPKRAIDAAKDIIYGDREKTYGNPARNLQCIAEMWNAYIGTKLDKAERSEDSWFLNAKDVAVMMTLVKASRFANDPNHPDNVIDGIGYWALVERCDAAE